MLGSLQNLGVRPLAKHIASSSLLRHELRRCGLPSVMIGGLGPRRQMRSRVHHATKPPSEWTAVATTSNDDADKDEDAESFPTIEDAKQLPLAYRKMDNVSLVTLGGMGEHSARKEILIRHIMAVDEVPYQKAYRTFERIEAANDKGIYLLGLPFTVGAIAMVVSGLASIPLVFDISTVEWFNEKYVTLDEPPPKDIETWLEVGAWSWNWMEPLLGTSTFVLMCMQYFRLNMDQLGIKPYTQRLRYIRAKRLAQQFPRYDQEVLMNYSETATIYKYS